MTIQEIRKALQECLVGRHCTICPYYKYYYDDDVDYAGQYSCWGKLWKDTDEAILRLEILTDEE